MVSHQSRRVTINATAANHLASEVITDQHGHSKLLPSARLVPSSVCETVIALTVPILLIAWHWTKTRRQLADP